MRVPGLKQGPQVPWGHCYWTMVGLEWLLLASILSSVLQPSWEDKGKGQLMLRREIPNRWRILQRWILRGLLCKWGASRSHVVMSMSRQLLASYVSEYLSRKEQRQEHRGLCCGPVMKVSFALSWLSHTHTHPKHTHTHTFCLWLPSISFLLFA